MIRHVTHLTLAVALLAAGISPVAAQSAQRSLDTRAYIDVSRAVLPAVVNITVENVNRPEDTSASAAVDQDLIQLFMDQRGLGAGGTAASGSGVVTRVEGNQGYIVTNNHVIQPLNERRQLRLTFHRLTPGTTDFSTTTEIAGSNARVIGRDQLSDLAVIEFDMPEGFEIQPVEWADSDTVEIGEHVVALGNPLDLNHTVTTGIISGKSRYLGKQISLERLLQTNAVIQPGNSGGPLVNLDGKIVGINNAIASRNGLWQGTSFAIPSNDAKRISNQLIDQGRVSRGYLGVTMQDLFMVNPEIVLAYGLRREEGGVFIKTVVRNSPADIAGIHVDDVVTAIDGQPIRTSDEMLQTIARRPVDSEVNISVIRLGENKTPQNLTMKARLTERPDESIINDLHGDPNLSNEVIPKIQVDPDTSTPGRRDLGMRLTDWHDPITKESGLQVQQVAPNSPGARAGLRRGDVITQINGRSVRTMGDFRAALAVSTGDHKFLVQRDGVSQLVVVTP
jgi:serine protease Do